MAAKRRTRSKGTTTVTRTRKGRAKGGTRNVTRTHSRSTPSLGSPGSKSTKRKATVKTKGGLKRTANLSKTTTGSGAGRVAKTRRAVTRVKNGVKTKTVTERINRGGKVIVRKRTKRTKVGKPAGAKRSGGTTAPRRRRRK